VRRLAALFLCALLAGCGGAKHKLGKLDSGAVVLAFGDSLTYGTGANQNESYPAVLERAIGRKVVNAGVPGETSAQGRERLPDVLEEVKPRLLILCHGGNDFLRKLPETQAAANVRAMVKLARTRGIEVLLIGTPEPGFSVTPPAFYAGIAKEFAVPYEDAAIAQVLKDASLKSDPIHPNAQGYGVIAERIAERLRKSGAI